MARTLTVALGVALATGLAAAALFVALPGEEEPPVVVVVEPTTRRLAFEFPSDRRAFECGVCHYAWDVPADVAATRTDPGSGAGGSTSGVGSSTYRLSFAAQSGYELRAVLAAPLLPGTEPPAAFREYVPVRGPPDVEHEYSFELPWPARAVLVNAWPWGSYSRPEVSVRLEVPGFDAVEASGSAPNRVAFLAAPQGRILEGPVAVRVSYSGFEEQAWIHLMVRAWPEQYQAAATPGAGVPAEFAWTLPSPGEPGSPERFHVFFLAFNAHPTEKWMLPQNHDMGEYDGFVSARDALVEEPPTTWSQPEIGSVWGGADEIVLYEEAFDGVRVRHHENGTGVWRRHSVAVEDGVPEEAPFPPIPPGTTYVKMEVMWEKRSPAVPDPRWTFAVTHRPRPDFGYPPANVSEPGRMVAYVPISPDEWEDPTAKSGWFQGFALMATDGEGKIVWDGRHEFRLTAHRGEPPS